VLGTRLTRQGTVYPRTLAARGIAAEIPRADDRASLHKIIGSELVSGVCTNRARQECVGLIERMAAGGCDSVAFVCTEIRSCQRLRTRRPRAGLDPAASPRR
jgi:aspartate racemase